MDKWILIYGKGGPKHVDYFFQAQIIINYSPKV